MNELIAEIKLISAESPLGQKINSIFNTNMKSTAENVCGRKNVPFPDATRKTNSYLTIATVCRLHTHTLGSMVYIVGPS